MKKDKRNQSENNHIHNIRAGLIAAKTKYGVTMDEYDYLDLAVDFLRDVVDYDGGDYFTLVTSDEKGNLSLPCNLQVIDAVVNARLGLRRYRDRIPYNEDNPLSIDKSIEAYDRMDMLGVYPDYSSIDRLGEGYLVYHFTDKRKIHVGKPNYEVLIAYQGINLDEESFPLITRKQINGLAAMVWFNRTLFKANKGDKIAGNMLQVAQLEAGRLKQAASIPEHINDNELDELLNAKTSFNRKAYRRPNKLSR
jgi:hypothetical protein